MQNRKKILNHLVQNERIPLKDENVREFRSHRAESLDEVIDLLQNGLLGAFEILLDAKAREKGRNQIGDDLGGDLGLFRRNIFNKQFFELLTIFNNQLFGLGRDDFQFADAADAEAAFLFSTGALRDVLHEIFDIGPTQGLFD